MMKNARLVLFAMIVSAPLYMHGSDDKFTQVSQNIWSNGAVSVFENHEKVDKSDVDYLCAGLCESLKKDALAHEQKALEDAKFDQHSKNAKNLCIASGLSAAAFGGSVLAQKYGKLPQDSTIAQAQSMALGSAATTGVLALNETRHAYQDYAVTGLKSFWNSFFNASQEPQAAEKFPRPVAAADALNLNDFSGPDAAPQTVATQKRSPKKQAAWLSSRNVFVTSALALAGTFAAQKYAADNAVVRDPKFVYGQAALGATALASGSRMVANSTFATTWWNNLFGSAEKVEKTPAPKQEDCQ